MLSVSCDQIALLWFQNLSVRLFLMLWQAHVPTFDRISLVVYRKSPITPQINFDRCAKLTGISSPTLFYFISFYTA
jgi:hypothetical protein